MYDMKIKKKKRKDKPILKRARVPAEAAAKTGFRKFIDPVVRRWKLIVAVVGGLAVVGLVVGGYFYYRYDREARAARAYGRVQEKIADLVQEQVEKQGEEVKLDEDKINALTVTELQNLIERYGGTATGRAAKYELASLYFDEGKFEEARPLFVDVEKKGAGLEGVLAAKGVADCDKAAGDYEAAIPRYERIFEDYKGEFPCVPVAMDLAECYKLAGRAEDATPLYRYVLDYHRLSPYAERARRELAKVEAEAAVKEKPM
jgi:tetratricopeptide (TPR) repeat protein